MTPDYRPPTFRADVVHRVDAFQLRFNCEDPRFIAFLVQIVSAWFAGSSKAMRYKVVPAFAMAQNNAPSLQLGTECPLGVS